MLKDCESGDIKVCNDLSAKYRKGIDGFPKDWERSIQPLKIACANEYAPACSDAGNLTWSIAKDVTQREAAIGP